MTRDGRFLSPRSISKIRLQERVAAGAEKNLMLLGARKRAFGEDPVTWVDEVLSGDTFIRVRHPGNTSAEKRRPEASFAPAKPYPKKLDQVQQRLDLFSVAA